MNSKLLQRKWLQQRTHAVTSTLWGAVSVPVLFLRLRKLRDSVTPDGLVDFSLRQPAIRPQQIRSEFLEFARVVADAKPRAALEIGTYRGGTLFVIAKLAAPDATIISIDLPTTTLGPLVRSAQAPILSRFVHAGQKLHLVRENSHEIQTRLHISEILAGRELDLLFIDGDHSYAGVKGDFDMYSPLVRRGGLVAFHDIAGTSLHDTAGVRKFWAEVKCSYQNLEIIHERGHNSMGIGLLWV